MFPKQILPPRLRPGSRVALVAPSGPLLERDDLTRAQELCQALEFVPQLFPNAGKAYGYLAGRDALFQHRIDDGWVRDGHGDLMADDIYLLPDGPRILDCLEFDERYRIGDVVNDVDFLAMDLERLGRPDLARRFLALYREMAAAPWPASLAHHLIAYRAHVRAKVGALRQVHGEVVEARGEAGPGVVVEVAARHLGAAAALGQGLVLGAAQGVAAGGGDAAEPDRAAQKGSTTICRRSKR